MGSLLGYSFCVSMALCIIQKSIGAAHRDYYKTLNLSREATEHEIKLAFRKLAVKYHPDKDHSPDAQVRFQEIQRAFEVLTDPMKRSMHDIKLGMEDQYRMEYGSGGLPNLGDLQVVLDVATDPEPVFDSAEVVTGYYVTVDHVSGFEPPPDRLFHPRASVRLKEEPEWDEDMGSITCTTFKADSGDDASHAKHTQCR